MRRGLTLAVVAVALLVTFTGCKKKKPVLPPPQAQAPDIRRIPHPEVPEPLPPAGTAAGKTTPAKPKPQHKKKAAKKHTPKPEKKKTVKNGGNTEQGGQLSAGLSSSESIAQRRNAAQLLDATQANLRSLRRSLSNDEQSMVQQIRTYMAQSRSANANGDTERAYNLALKANLLSQELVKR